MKKFSESLKEKLRSKNDAKEPDYHVIPMQRRGNFQARAIKEGVEVSCLPGAPVLPWELFDDIQTLLSDSPSRLAIRGNAMHGRLGDERLPLDSVEGRIALFFGYKPGDAVFRRVSPVANLLVWSGACRHVRGALVMV